jgi:hypothetical protein
MGSSGYQAIPVHDFVQTAVPSVDRKSIRVRRCAPALLGEGLDWRGSFPCLKLERFPDDCVFGIGELSAVSGAGPEISGGPIRGRAEGSCGNQCPPAQGPKSRRSCSVAFGPVRPEGRVNRCPT